MNRLLRRYRLHFFLALIIFSYNRGTAQLLTEDFAYTSGTNLTASGAGWSAFSSGGLNPIKVHTSGLVWAGYPNSNVGNAISLQSIAGEDVERSVSTTLSASESIYAGFLIQPTSGSTGSLLLNFEGNGAACTDAAGFVFRNSLGNLQFGLHSGSSTSFYSTNYTFGSTFLIILEYNATAKTYSLYINPNLDGSKPAANHSVTHSCSSGTSISSIRIYQDLLAGAAILDGLRVSKSWSEIVGTSGGGGGGSANLLKDENFDYTAGNNISNFSGWTSCCGSATVMAGSLSYSAYGSSGVANGLSVVSGAQPELTFMQQSSGSIYAGFLAVGTSSIQAYFDGSVCGGFQSTSENTPQIPISPNPTFIVVEIDLANRFYYYYVNPPMGASKPAPSYVGGGGWGGSCVDYINSLVFEVISGGAAIDGIRVGTNWSDIVAIETPVNQPTAPGFQNRQSNAVDLYYTQAPDLPSGYLVVRKSGSIPTGTPSDNATYSIGNTLGDGTVIYSGASTSITDNTSILPETAYYYAIFSMNSGGSDTKYLTTSPLTANTLSLSAEPSGAPSFGASSSSSSQIELSFSAASTLTNADGYLIYRSAQAISSLSFATDGNAPGTFSLPAGVSLVTTVTNNATTSFNDAGLSPNTNYHYALVPYNFDGVNNSTYNYYSANVTGVTGLTRTVAPVATAATTPSKNSFIANWNATTGATSYRIDVATSSGFGGDILGGYNDLAASGTSQTISGLASNSTYYYRVRAVNASGASVSSNTISKLTLTEPPVALIATGVTESALTMNWTSVTGATEYYLEVSGSASFSTILELQTALPITGTSYSLSNMDAGTTLYYRVRAVNSSGASEYSNTMSVTTIPPAPIATSATGATGSSFTTNWNSSTGASSYKLDVSLLENFSSILASYDNLTVNGTSQVVSGLAPNTVYYFRVRATNDFGVSTASNTISQLTATAAPVAQSATAISETGFTMNWGAVSGATEYYLEVSGSPAFTTTIEFPNAITGTSQTLSGQPGGTTYYYRVRGVNAAGPSEYSNTVSVITVSPAPVATAATFITTTSFTANWNATTGAAEYKLDVCLNDFNTLLPSYDDLTVTGTSLSITGLSEGQMYKYRVRAVNASGTSASSNVITVLTVPPVPTALAATSITTNSFNANWSIVSGATKYLLYVSSNSNFLSGYNPKELETNSESVVGLQPNTSYQYYIKATSSSGTSEASQTISAVTLATAPTNPSASLITQTGFTANWTAVSGITEYALDVSLDNFTSNVAGYDNLLVNSSSQGVTGLTPGLTYKFRVRSRNITGASSNSGEVSVLLIPGDPVATAATGYIKAGGFQANWNAVAGTETYHLDVSTQANFSSFVTGYDNKSIAGNKNSEIIEGLMQGTLYHYRVRAKNGSGTSGSSGTISLTTIPAPPVNLGAPNKNDNQFVATWSKSQGATYYEIDVSTLEADFSSFLTGYNGKVITSELAAVTGLSPGIYAFRVRAGITAGESDNSATFPVIIEGEDFVPLSVSENTSITEFTGTSVVISGQISKPVGAFQAKLHYRGIAESDFSQTDATITGSGSTLGYQVSITSEMLDELGVEYFIEVKDAANQVASTPTKQIFRSATGKPLLTGTFAGNRSSMRIIAFAYDLSNKSASVIFESLGVYNKKTWRLAHYQDGKNVEFQSAGFPSIDRGMGFWFNAKGSIDIAAGAASSGSNDKENSFEIQLVEGWNQIGNPYPFAIDWSDVLDDNNTAATGVGDLRTYKGESQNFIDTDDLGVFEGAFVFAENATSLELNVDLKNTFTSGRKRLEQISSDLEGDSWQLPIILIQGESRLDLAGIGMHPEAHASKDAFDDIRLPRLDEYLDVTFEHPEYKFSHFSKDIIPTSNEHIWTFSVESSNALEGITLQWDNSMFGENSAHLFLLDLTDATVVDMRKQNNYYYNGYEKREFRIYYSRSHKEFSPGICIASAPFPNPAKTSVNVNMVLPDAHKNYSVLLQIYDFTGKPVREVLYSDLRGGMHQLQWNTDREVAAGTYFLRTSINGKAFGPVKRVVVLN